MKISWIAKQIFRNNVILWFIIFLFPLFALWSSHIDDWGDIVIYFVILFVLLTLFKKYSRKLDNFFSGSKGESDVGDVLLNDLPKSYINLPDINLERKGNIDYVLVGPTGIWIIEVKSHVGNMTFDGTALRRGGKLLEKDFLKQSWAEAYSVKNLLKQKIGRDFFVQPVIVFSNSRAKMKFGFNKVRGVYIINLNWLSKLVLRGEYALKTEDVEAITDIIEQSNIKD